MRTCFVDNGKEDPKTSIRMAMKIQYDKTTTQR